MVLVQIADIILVGIVAFMIIKRKFNDSSLGRVLAVLGFIAGAILYLYLLAWADNSPSSSIFLFCLIYFGPVAIFLIILLIGYASGGRKN